TEGVSWNLYSLLGNGKTVLLDFFFAACVPCQTYTPEIEQLYQDYGSGSSDLIVLGISDRDDDAVLDSFAIQYNVTYPSGGKQGNGNLITSNYMSWFSFPGWPQYGVVCSDTTIFWGLTASIGMAALRSKIDTCSIITSTSNLKRDVITSSISIYPQPANEMVSIQLENPKGRNVSIVLLNLLGSVVKEYILENSGGIIKQSINTKNLPAGTYILQIVEGNRVLSRSRVIITH
ncbi:MAG: hypothetical protein COB85_02575, partial [Bacteroidetes bacterium]